MCPLVQTTGRREMGGGQHAVSASCRKRAMWQRARCKLRHYAANKAGNRVGRQKSTSTLRSKRAYAASSCASI